MCGDSIAFVDDGRAVNVAASILLVADDNIPIKKQLQVKHYTEVCE